MPRDADSLRIAKWASQGDVQTPEDRGLNRAEGWGPRYSQTGGELPARRVFNQIIRELSAIGVELNSHGLLEWDATVEYTQPALVMGSNGDPYVLRVGNSVGTNPTTDDGTTWGHMVDLGWTPRFSVVTDGIRRVLRLVGYTGGSGTAPTVPANNYVGSTGLGTLAAATDLRGQKGDPGNSGWSPKFAVATDGARRILQVSDWAGGGGAKPTTGEYVGASGLVPSLTNGVDIRGPAGEDGDDGIDGRNGSSGIPSGTVIYTNSSSSPTGFTRYSSADLSVVTSTRFSYSFFHESRIIYTDSSNRHIYYDETITTLYAHRKT